MPMMPGPAARLKKLLIFLHRWMGVGLCLLFAMWFSSGMVLMYWDYPSVSAADRLDRAPALDPLEIRLSPQQAYLKLATSEPPTEVRVETLDQRPAYKFRFGAFDRIVYADNGQEQSDFTPEFTLRTAAAWTRQPSATAKAEELTAEDQWTVSGEFSELRPLRKYSWPDGEEVYVSTVTGEVAQYTTRASRVGAYFGAIPHWLYFTPLRHHAAAVDPVGYLGVGPGNRRRAARYRDRRLGIFSRRSNIAARECRRAFPTAAKSGGMQSWA